MSSKTVSFSTVPLSHNEGMLGVITLNRTEVLNALDQEMIDELLGICEEIDRNESIKGLWFESSIEKAFCVGGDVRHVTERGSQGGVSDITRAAHYLASEYALDVRLHQLKVPIFSWGDGYIMGGGMGIFQGADVRMVTEHSKLAMPEVKIGFVPDCGGSWFLNRVTHGLGICLAMSGSTVDASDAIWLNLADWLIPRIEKEEVFQTIIGLDYSSKTSATDMLSRILNQATFESEQQGLWEINGPSLATSIRHLSPKAVWAQMVKWKEMKPEVLHGLDDASPGAALIAGYQFYRARYQSITSSIIQEHDLGMKFLQDGEWCEGVRALLIDKDKNPNWRFATVENVEKQWVETMLAPMEWVNSHPLKELFEKHKIKLIR